MPSQDVTTWTSDTCGCRLYTRVDAAGNTIFLDHQQVIAEQQARIQAGDPTANRELTRPARLCPDHANLGHTLSQALVGVIRGEQGRRNRILSMAHGQVDIAPEGYEWSFTPDRVLHVRIGKLTPQQMARGSALENMGRFLTPSERAEANLLLRGDPLSAIERSQLQTQADLEFGPGKAVVS